MTFTSPFNHFQCGGHGITLTPIELIPGSLFPQLIGWDLTRVSYQCWHSGGLSLFTQPSLFATQSQHRSPQVHRHYACDLIAQRLGPNVHHPATLLLAHSPRLIDFPLLCHRGGLFKHTFCDVRPHTARHA